MSTAKLTLAVMVLLMLDMVAGMGLVARNVFADNPTQGKESDQFGDPLPPRVLARLGPYDYVTAALGSC